MSTHRMASLGMLILVASLIVLQVPSHAEGYGDPVQGAILVQRVCGACHGVARGEASPAKSAPNFSDIASIRGMSETALNVALLTPHHSMPNLVLGTQERSDVIAFILGLRPPQ